MIHVDRLLDDALAEDLGLGDVTTRATVDEDATGEAQVTAKEPLVVAGLDVFARVFARLDDRVRVASDARDGDRLETGATVARLEGPLVSILEGERVALNFLQRMSGIATLTRSFVEQVPEGSAAAIVDTRKTTPGLRELERYAVRCGGGRNHRPRLDGGILIKDNHIAAAGGVPAAVRRARLSQGPALRVEVEVSDLDQLDEALAAGADVVMLDNMSLAAVREAMERCRGKVLVEVSGGITVASVADLCRAGVDFISVGALTHSARAVDLSLLVSEC